jgi:hypothetical protein
MTGHKSKPAAGEVTAIRGGAVTLAEAADAVLSSRLVFGPGGAAERSGQVLGVRLRIPSETTVDAGIGTTYQRLCRLV